MMSNVSYGAGSLILAVIGSGIGAGAFLFVRPSIPIKPRLEKVSIFGAILPFILYLFGSVQGFDNMERHLALVPYLSIFIAGTTAGGRILFEKGQ